MWGTVGPSITVQSQGINLEMQRYEVLAIQSRSIFRGQEKYRSLNRTTDERFTETNLSSRDEKLERILSTQEYLNEVSFKGTLPLNF